MHTSYTGYTDTQENVSFAQHPGGSDCKSRQYRCFLNRNVFRLDLKEGRLRASRRGLGRELQVTGPVCEEARFPYFLSLMRGIVMRSESAERREREGGQTERSHK